MTWKSKGPGYGVGIAAARRFARHGSAHRRPIVHRPGRAGLPGYCPRERSIGADAGDATRRDRNSFARDSPRGVSA